MAIKRGEDTVSTIWKWNILFIIRVLSFVIIILIQYAWLPDALLTNRAAALTLPNQPSPLSPCFLWHVTWHQDIIYLGSIHCFHHPGGRQHVHYIFVQGHYEINVYINFKRKKKYLFKHNASTYVHIYVCFLFLNK